MLRKYNLKESDIVVGVCSRFDPSKGLKYVIERGLHWPQRSIKILK